MANDRKRPDRFRFTVTDLGRYLGKASVTLRGWERDGLVSYPRDSKGNRKFTTTDIRKAANWAKENQRISCERFRLIEASMTLLELLEKK